MHTQQFRKVTLPALLCILVWVGESVAQEPRTLTYDDAIAIALKGSYTVKSYQASLQAMKFSFDYYRAQFKPRIDFSMNAPSLIENVAPIERIDGLPVYNSTGVMKSGGELRFTYMLPIGGNLSLYSQLYREDRKTVLALKDYETLKDKNANSSFSLNFEQPIFTKNTLKENLQQAEYQYMKSTHVFTRTQMNIVYDVTNGFYSLYQAIREVEIAQEKLKNSEEAYRIARLKNESGRIPEGEVLIAEVDMSSDRAALLESEGKLAREKDSLKQLIGLDTEDDINIVTDLQYDTFAVDVGKAVEEALKNRLEITESDLDIKLQEIKIDQANRIREFKGTISAYYDLTGVSTVGSGSTRSLFESSFDNFVDRPPNRGVTLTFSYPVFDWGRGASRVQQETVTLKRIQLEKEDLELTIIREVKEVCRQVEETKARLIIHEKNQQNARRSYEISLMRFENGDISSQQLAQQQETLADTQMAYLRAFIAYQLAVADLKKQTLWDFKNNHSYLIDTYFQEK